MSRAALIQRAGERGEYVFLSNDGHGDLPKRQIEEGLARGALVQCGFDNDADGAKLWQQVKETYPRVEAIVRERPLTGAKDWNDALRPMPERAEELGQGQEDDRAPGRSRGHGGSGRDEHGCG